MRRVHLKGRINILKRLLVQAAGFNLGLVMRQLFGVGKPRRLQGRCACFCALWRLIAALYPPIQRLLPTSRRFIASPSPTIVLQAAA